MRLAMVRAGLTLLGDTDPRERGWGHALGEQRLWKLPIDPRLSWGPSNVSRARSRSCLVVNAEYSQYLQLLNIQGDSSAVGVSGLNLFWFYISGFGYCDASGCLDYMWAWEEAKPMASEFPFISIPLMPSCP